MSLIQSDVTYVKIYDSEFKCLTINAKPLLANELDNVESLDNNEIANSSENIPQKPKCSYCNIFFHTIEEQREHYKLDWHSFNLNRRIEAQCSVTQEQFNELRLKENESDSDTSEDSELEEITYRGCIFYKNDKEQVFSLYKCFVTEEIVECQKDKLWTILMVSGGHFAGAVFQNGIVLVHKTFHSYTVRAKQGGSQISTDNRKGSSYPKSAGASLRRYNNASFVQHIQEILRDWKDYIDASYYIFYRAAGPNNRSILFSGKYPALQKNAKNMSIIPFSTRKPTYSEVQHVYSKLNTVHIYCNIDEVLNMFQKSPKKSELNMISTNKPQEEVLKVKISTEKKEEIIMEPSKEEGFSGSDEGPVDLITEDQEINFNDSLKPFACTRKPKRRNKERANNRKILIEATLTGNLELVQNTLTEKNIGLLNDPMDADKNRLLHLASKNGHKELVTWLLNFGANPCLKNIQNQSGYTASKSIEIEDIYRTFAKENPDKYDYLKAGLPSEVRKKKKEEKKAKKKEQEKINKYLELSEADKQTTSIKRCFLCGKQMAENRIPFEYSGNKFCSIGCLHEHRVKFNSNKC